MTRQFSQKPTLRSATDVAAYLRPRLLRTGSETFWLLSFNARGQLIDECVVAMGSLATCLVHPREVFRPALAAEAAYVVLAHNHPSNDPRPSAEDMRLTERLTRVGRLLGILLVDHVIVTATRHTSIGIPQRPLGPRALG